MNTNFCGWGVLCLLFGIKPAGCHAFHVTTLLLTFSPPGQLARVLTDPLEHRLIGHGLTSSLTVSRHPEVSDGTGGVRTSSSATSERTTLGRSNSHEAQRREGGEGAGGTETNRSSRRLSGSGRRERHWAGWRGSVRLIHLFWLQSLLT